MARKVIGMARNVAGPRGSRRRRWTVLFTLVLAVSGGLFLMQTVLAVHDLEFELDGNVNPGDPAPGVVDWTDIFNSSGQPVATLPANFEHAGFEPDFQTQILKGVQVFSTDDHTTYATGSKDTLGVSPGWQCTRSNNTTDKDDIMNAYAASYKDPATGDDILYFALERNANTGDANIGFWFLQNDINCASPGGALAFTGHHSDGDIFIVSAFTKGGDVSTITVYRWTCTGVGQACDDSGAALFKDSAPVASGVDCRDPNLPLGDPACAAANRVVLSGATGLPWLTSNKNDNVGHSLRIGEFFEGGLNLTQTGLGGKCFNVFIGNTRSSQSLTATIFDYARGQLGECTSTTVTTPSITSPTPIPPNASLLVTDSAEVTVNGIATFSGDVAFFLCGPFAVQTLCADDPAVANDTGVPAGTRTITDAAGSATVVSDSLRITSVGYYCWRAEFTASTPNVPPSRDSRASECFQITPLTPVLTTQAGTTPVDLGQPVTDTAPLAGTAFHPGSGGPAGSVDGSINPTVEPVPAIGTITFTLYKNDCTTLATGTGTNPQDRPVSGDGVYGPVSFTPDAPGTYHWRASYSGDSPNTLGDTHNQLCNDTNETVVVRQIPTTIKSRQSWFPNDTATVASTVGNLGAGGTVVFTLYNNATCQGAFFYTETKTITGGTPSQEVSTNNTTVPITTLYTDPANTAVTFSWKVVYTPAASDTAHTGKQSACNAERFTITYTNDPGPGTNLP